MSNWAENALGELYRPGGVYHERVQQDTWGHLAPQKNITYKGEILISNSGYGNNGIQIVDMNWKNVRDNPWMYDTINEFLWENRKYIEEGSICKANITMRNYRYWIKITETIKL